MPTIVMPYVGLVQGADGIKKTTRISVIIALEPEPRDMQYTLRRDEPIPRAGMDTHPGKREYRKDGSLVLIYEGAEIPLEHVDPSKRPHILVLLQVLRKYLSIADEKAEIAHVVRDTIAYLEGLLTTH